MTDASVVQNTNVVTMADKRRLGYTGSVNRVLSRDSDSWFTPAAYVQAARDVMGGIDLDPFSSVKANEIIQARRFFDINHSAFESLWRKPKQRPLRVWLNPPYSSGVMGRAVSLFVEQLQAGNIAQAVVLTNNASDTQWFKALREHCQAVCLTDRRIAFENVDGKAISGNTRGQTFFYFGPQSQAAAFRERFKDWGWSISKSRGWE